MLKLSIACVALAVAPLTTQAMTFVEDFEADFPAWESGWFGTQTDAYNHYCARPCDFRGNNPDGLWLGSVDGAGSSGPIDVVFESWFGAGVQSLSIDVAAFIDTTLRAYDMAGVEIFTVAVTPTYGAWTDPGVYVNYLITSNNGISHFGFDDGSSGNTSVDNIVLVNTVPEPQTWALALIGLGVLVWGARKRKT